MADGTDPHPEEAEGARGDKDPTRSAEVVDREDEPPPAPATPDGRVADDVTDGGLCCWDDTEKNPSYESALLQRLKIDSESAINLAER